MSSIDVIGRDADCESLNVIGRGGDCESFGREEDPAMNNQRVSIAAMWPFRHTLTSPPRSDTQKHKMNGSTE